MFLSNAERPAACCAACLTKIEIGSYRAQLKWGGSVSDWWRPKSTSRSLLRSEDDEISEDIKIEALELLESLNLWYSECGGRPPQEGQVTSDQVNEVFRPLHTLKGLCLMGNMGELAEIVHHIEDRISLTRDGLETFDQRVFDQLGDLLQIFEQFFAFYPDDIPDVVKEAIEQHKAVYSSSGPEDSGQSGAEADPLAAGAEESEIDPEMVALSEEAAGDDQPSEHADPVDTVDLAQGAEVAAAGQKGSGEIDLMPTAEESARFADFCGRNENLLAVLYCGEQFNNRSAVQAYEGYENLTRVVEIIYERSVSNVGTLIVFASDLDAEMAGSLAQAEVKELERLDLALAAFPDPWCFVAFDSSVAGAVSGSDLSDFNPEPDPDLVANATAAPPSAPGSNPPSVAVSAEADLPFEDFDSINQGANQAAMELDQEMLDDFLTNADDLLEELTQSMLELESDPDNMDAVDTIFRAAHTIKGTAGMFGFRAIEKLTHVMENTFDRIRKGELKAGSALMDGLLQALDRIRACFEALKDGKSGELSINDALNQVLQADYAAQNGISLNKTSAAPVDSNSDRGESHASSSRPVLDSVTEPPPKSSIDAHPPEPVKGAASSGQPKGGGGKKKKDEGVGTIRVDLKRLDALVNLVGELVIDRTRFARIEETLRMSGQNSELLHTMSETLLLFGRHMNDVQSIIMKVRMVPVGNAFYKFTRVVRDLARTCGKEIDLLIEGGETELDKTLVEEIGDPLVHIIRNSADHGIETPEERVAAGKSPRGTITLRAYQDGNMIVIFISDDGKGLQPERIKNKAIAIGLISESDPLSDREIYNLIFEPGFSTAEKVTNISGRGVGMDAVKKSIVKLKGVVDIDSVPGSGTQISIKLPLTLAIIPSLLVESCKETYAIPLVNVIESIRISPEEIQRIGHSDFVKLRERVLPLLRLADVFSLNRLEEHMWYSLPHLLEGEDDGRFVNDILGMGGPNGAADSGDLNKLKPTSTLGAQVSLKQEQSSSPNLMVRGKRSKQPRLIFVVVGVGEQRVGLIVDQLMGQQEIVIKSLGRILGRSRGVSGGCVLGNGRVALVVDVGELIEDHSDSGRGGAHRVAS